MATSVAVEREEQVTRLKVLLVIFGTLAAGFAIAHLAFLAYKIATGRLPDDFAASVIGHVLGICIGAIAAIACFQRAARKSKK